MKINVKSIIFIITALTLMSYKHVGNAATLNPITETTTVSISDYQIVQVLPEGGFIYNSTGESTFDSNIVEHNDGVLMTYKEYKELPPQEGSISGGEMFPMTRAANPYSQRGKILAYDEVYVSNEFSGTGWRFSNLKFIAANGTGRYLKWTSLNDSGRVGGYNSATSTYQGRGIYGVPLEIGQTVYVDTQSDWLYYYTYNPAKGTRYMVENK